MPTHAVHPFALKIVCFALVGWMLIGWMLAVAQPNPGGHNKDGQNKDDQTKPDQTKPPVPPIPGAQYSGMYGFLRDGEFVQITVENQEGRVTGVVSRYGDSEGASGVFLEHFFKAGKLEGNQLAFTTETVQGVSFDFRGTVERGEGKTRVDEAYYVLKGTLVENQTDGAKKSSSSSHEVVLKAFPQDVAPHEAQSK
jgi:hypothetical protein